MKPLLLSLFAMACGVAAQEVVLYDVDYRGATASTGQTVPTENDAFPGRTTCSAIISGIAEIGAAPPELSDTAALLMSQPVVDPSGETSFSNSQLEFGMVGGGVYVFREHRIEVDFQIANPDGFSGSDEFRILTDGGVTSSLNFFADGSVTMLTNVTLPPPASPDQIYQQPATVGTFDPHLPVHLVWETRVPDGSTTVTVNGVPFSLSGLTPISFGLRNRAKLPGPLAIRLSLADSNGDSPVALRNFRVTGSNYDGPLFQSPADPVTSSESGVVIVPIDTPASGTWQPEYSHDGQVWSAFGGVVGAWQPLNGFGLGTLGGARMLVRLRSVP